MKILFDLFPVILFVVAYVLTDDLFIATGAIIAATVAQVAWQHFRHGRVDKMLWVTLGIVLVLGSLTLILQDKRFILWKPTVVYWIFAVALLGAQYFAGKNLIRALLGKEITAPDAVWNRINVAWACFFFVMGFVNLYVAFTYSEAFWVQFKLWGFTGILLVFALAQGFYLTRHAQTTEDKT
ncbi:MAG: septation protein A [Betaproteobacteria bacterium]|nr:septation protein A [Betaproteobacteria bacterium]